LVEFFTEKFVGTWRLVSMETRGEGGEISYPLGKDAIGYITYTREGYFSVITQSKNRRKFATLDLMGGTVEEKVAAANSFIGYCGEYEAKDDKVIHHVELSFFPNWVGGDQERQYEFKDNRLTLSTGIMPLQGRMQSARIVWERAKSASRL